MEQLKPWPGLPTLIDLAERAEDRAGLEAAMGYDKRAEEKLAEARLLRAAHALIEDRLRPITFPESVGLACRVCHTRSPKGGPAKHGPGCLAAAYRAAEKGEQP